MISDCSSCISNCMINSSVAVLLVRLITGILFFFQGYDKLFNVKIKNIALTFSEPLSKIRFPAGFIRPAIALSSFVELIGGILIFLGLFKCMTLYFIAADLVFIAFIFSAVKPMWDMQFFFPRLIFILMLLFTSSIPDLFSLDHCFATLK